MSLDTRIRIIGPTVAGEFFFSDSHNNIWDGKHWRGFGIPKMFSAFRDAFSVREKAAKAYVPFAAAIQKATP